MNETQGFIRGFMLRWREAKRVSAAIKRQARQDGERQRAALEILLDDICAETGLPPDHPLVWAAAIEVMEAKAARAESKARAGFMEGFEKW